MAYNRSQMQDAHSVHTTLLDFYIIEKIGDGAYSEVFKVKRMTDGKVYALKKVSFNTTSNNHIGKNRQVVVEGKRERIE